MRVDFRLNDDEILTANVTRVGNGFVAVCESVIGNGSTIQDSVEKLRHGLNRYFLKVRCVNAIATANPR